MPMQTQGSPMQAMQPPLMMQPPRVITNKDLSFLKDEMSWELLAMKKCAHFAKECQDVEVRQLIDQIGQMHERHYNIILNHCKTQNTQAMAGLPTNRSAGQNMPQRQPQRLQ